MESSQKEKKLIRIEARQTTGLEDTVAFAGPLCHRQPSENHLEDFSGGKMGRVCGFFMNGGAHQLKLIMSSERGAEREHRLGCLCCAPPFRTHLVPIRGKGSPTVLAKVAPPRPLMSVRPIYRQLHEWPELS